MKITIEILGLKGRILQRSGRDASSVRIYIFFFLILFFRRELLNEKPYLTEAGASVFDALYDTVIRQVSYIVKSPTLSPNMVPLQAMIKDSINVLIGVPSRTFHLDKVQYLTSKIKLL